MSGFSLPTWVATFVRHAMVAPIAFQLASRGQRAASAWHVA